LDETTNRPTLVLSTGNGKVFAIDIPTGRVADVWPDVEAADYNPADYEGLESFSSPIAYQRNLSGDKLSNFSNFAIGFENESTKKGFISGFYVDEGWLKEIDGFKKHHYYADELGANSHKIPTSIGVVEKEMDDGSKRYLFMYSDERGNIYCYDQRNEEILFKIEKHGKETGAISMNTPTIVQNEGAEEVYAIFTLSVDRYSKKGKIVCVDVNHALEEAENGNTNPESAIYWETNSNDFGGTAYSGSSAIAMLNMKDENAQAMIIAVDRGTNEKKDNLHAYYVNVRDGNEPAKVENAFLNSVTNEITSGLHIPGGIYGEPAFMAYKNPDTGDFEGGFMVVTSGKGVVHAFKYEPIDNLILDDFYKEVPEGALPDYSFDKGDTIKVSMDIVNQFGIAFDDVPIDITFDRGREDKEPKLISYHVLRNGDESVDGVQSVKDNHMQDSDIWGLDPIEEREEVPPGSNDYEDVWKGYERGFYEFKADIGPQGARVDLVFEVPEDYQDSDFKMFARLNPGFTNPVEPNDTDADNDNEKELILSSAQHEFAIRNMYVPDVRTKEDAFVKFDVCNDSDIDWEGNNLYLSINIYDESGSHVDGVKKKFETFTNSLRFKAGQSKTVSTTIALPGAEHGDRYRAVAFIDCNKNIAEKNEANNISSKYLDVDDDADGCLGNNKTSERTEDMLASANSHGGSTTDTWTEYWCDCSDEDCDGDCRSTDYKEITYEATMEMEVFTSRSQLKSGYGFVVEAEVTVDSDHDYNDGIRECSVVKVYTPNGDEYLMVKDASRSSYTDSGGYVTRFVLPTVTVAEKEGAYSIKENKIFVPLDYRDGTFNVRVCTGALSLSGFDEQLYRSKAFNIEIEGHMYEDINTRPTE